MNAIKDEMVHSDSFHCHLLLMAQDFMSRMKSILFTKSFYGTDHMLKSYREGKICVEKEKYEK